MPRELVSRVRECPGIVPLDEEHKGITNYIASSLSRNGSDDLSAYAPRAASLRRFVG
ncbi:MAG: hypothetical protein MUP64_16390 [Anaerolineae bacterium]|nr:hypothetical protein [Anaerolineae bacterium]